MTLRKRRLNHNEIEKKRRDQQRLQLDVLRQHLPKLCSERPSAVTTIVEATEYIRTMSQRIQDLEDYIKKNGLLVPHENLDTKPQTFITVPAEPHTMARDALLDFLQGTNHSLQPIQPRITPPASAASTPTSKGTNQLTVTRDYYDPNLLFINTRTGSLKRRDSAMLLPTSDPNMFLFGRRDSVQNMFSGPLPTIFDDFMQDNTEIKCTKCARGVENLIMIDCDTCHTWSHIKCVDLDPNQIPLQWKCAACSTKRIEATSTHGFMPIAPRII